MMLTNFFGNFVALVSPNFLLVFAIVEISIACVLGILVGFFAKKLNVLAGLVINVIFFSIWILLFPLLPLPGLISYLVCILEKFKILFDYQWLLAFIISMILYGTFGAIGGMLGSKLTIK